MMTAIELPAPDCRWGSSRKTAVVKAIEQGLLTVGEACQRYALTLDELGHWQRGGVTRKRVDRLRQADMARS